MRTYYYRYYYAKSRHVSAESLPEDANHFHDFLNKANLSPCRKNCQESFPIWEYKLYLWLAKVYKFQEYLAIALLLYCV